MQYLAIHAVKVFEIYSTHFFTSLVQDPPVRYVEKKISEVFCPLQKK